jgi:transposase-like protein
MNIEPYVPIEELAKHFTVSVSTVRAWVRQDLIPKHTYIKVGNTYRFSVSKVVESLTVPAPEPVQETPTSAPAEDETPVQLTLDFNNPDEDA